MLFYSGNMELPFMQSRFKIFANMSGGLINYASGPGFFSIKLNIDRNQGSVYC